MRSRWMPASAHPQGRDPLAQRQTPLLFTVLTCMVVGSLLRLLFFFAADQAAIGLMPTLVVDTISLSAPAFAILLLRRGYFTAATLLAALAMLVTISIATVATGLRHSGMLPMVFALPLIFTGLLLDWRGLSLVARSSCTVVAGIAVLERQGSPPVGFAPAPELPASMAATFVLIAGLLVVLLSRFRLDYQREIAELLRVEAEREEYLEREQAALAAATQANTSCGGSSR